MWSLTSSKGLITSRFLTLSLQFISGTFFVWTVAVMIDYDSHFHLILPGISALPLPALSLAVLWNFAAIVTTQTTIQKTFHIYGDLIVSTLIVIFGSIAIAHDSDIYGTAKWQQYNAEGCLNRKNWGPAEGWLNQDIVAVTFLLVSLLLQLGLAVLSYTARELQYRLQFTTATPQANEKSQEESRGNLALAYESSVTESVNSTRKLYLEP